MTEHAPDLRHSTLNALKLTCPSAEVLDSPEQPSPMENPFGDADAEWSDEEQLIPKSRRKALYVPPTVTVANRLSATETSSSGSNSPSPNRNSAFSVNGSPLIPPKSPSRPDIRPGSSQDDLVQRFYQVTRERDALRKELQRKSVGPHGIPRASIASVVYKSEEKTLIEELQALRYEIRNWSEEYFSGPLSSRSKRPHVHSAKDLFVSLTDNHEAYLKHHRDRPLLIQAYVWSKLQQRIFSNVQKGCGYVWAGKLGDRKLRTINDTLRKAVTNEAQAEEYHRWRAMTVNLLVPQVDGKWRPTFDAAPVLKRISRFCSRLRRKLRPWATQSLRLGKDQLHTIISAAVALDLKMKRQKADYRFVTFAGGKPNHFFGYGFYDSEMEDVDEDDHKPRRVELSLAPALERCGNANGHIFDQSFILIKADVSCKRIEKKRPPRKKQAGTKSGIRSVMNLWNSYA
ncbi:hypothetical protein K505DRAFT_377641 [Melanomma pulvis-pyrius CBS 109.77]|uniref:Uncharacterized protein n=1 Tax=Melanomma pulvis-pyrius CBS 109.77 TaxID=1314802 RepID=A0A6A6X222_9PLEO|nr:hypothetical protein K505DRAFT_377641 [Melanomma pulvis-pyrius CBS 109.77]